MSSNTANQQKRPFSFGCSSSIFKPAETQQPQTANSPKILPSSKAVITPPTPQPKVAPVSTPEKNLTPEEQLDQIVSEIKELSPWSNQQIRFLSSLLTSSNELNARIEELEAQFR